MRVEIQLGLALAGAAALFATGAALAQTQPVKPVVAVESVKGGNQENGDLRTMIETAILNTNRFTVMDRRQSDLLEKSRALCATGQIWRASGCVPGKITLPDYIISAAITTAVLEPAPYNVFNRGEDILSGKVNCVDSATMKAVRPRLAIDIRVTSATSQITAGESFNDRGDRVVTCDGAALDPAASFGGLMRKVSDGITQKLVLTSFPMEIIDVQPLNRVMLTYGEDVLAAKQQVAVFRKGPTRKDSSGRVFTTEIQVGTAQVLTLAPDSSIAELLCTSGGNAPQIGDLARPLTTTTARRQKPPKGATLPGPCP